MLGHLFGFERITGGAWLGLVITFVGAGIIVVGGAKVIDFSNATFLGNVLMLGAALLWGAYTAFSKPLSHHVRPSGIAFFGLLVALPFLIGLGVNDLDQVIWREVGLWVWGALLFSGGLSTGLAVAIWNTAVKQVGPSQTAVYGNLVPVVALLSGMVFLHEPVTAAQLGGGALILFGLFLMRRARRTVVAPVEA